MQLVGIALLFGVIFMGFMERSMKQVSSFDLHALLIILLGSLSAVLLGSSRTTAVKTFVCLKELVPGLKSMSRETIRMESERATIYDLWKSGKRAQALEIAEKSTFESTKACVGLLLARGHENAVEKTFTELRHTEMQTLQPALHNWELLAKLGPSFGMVGTITGMIQLFKTLGSPDANIGAAMSLALLATLYGVAFGAGIAGPIGHFLNSLLDERLGLLERCEKSVNDLVASGEG